MKMPAPWRTTGKTRVNKLEIEKQLGHLNTVQSNSTVVSMSTYFDMHRWKSVDVIDQHYCYIMISIIVTSSRCWSMMRRSRSAFPEGKLVRKWFSNYCKRSKAALKQTYSMPQHWNKSQHNLMALMPFAYSTIAYCHCLQHLHDMSES